ncbi:hypothetical protein HPP05_13220 [Corallococcus exiguus]|uniref:hypothetical protein n=1 Tax=Corallococcus exiguus TaxID=83462 RepID=UPI001494B3E5|nr:hypothetical protein [Corallococcus exiguus]NPC70707.1 hypothetical protein [Corallococcus exiguus]
MRKAELGSVVGLALMGFSCRHLTGPADLEGQPLLVCVSVRIASLPSCSDIGGEYRKAFETAGREFERELLEILGHDDSPDDVARCLARLDSYKSAVEILDENIDVHFIMTDVCLGPGAVWADGGATFRFQRGSLQFQRLRPE